MDKSLFSSLITWLRTFPGHADLTASSLTDGVTLGTILHQIAPEYFKEQWLAKIKIDVSDNWRLKVSNLRKIHQGVMDYFYSFELPEQSIHQFPTPDLNKIVEHEDEIEIGRLLQLILGCAINCEQKQKHIEAIMGMEEGVQTLIVNAIQDLMNRESSPGPSEVSGGSSLSGAWLGPASFHPHMKTLLEQLESTSLAKEDMTRRCNELDLQITVLNEEKKKVKEENDKMLERIEILECGGDIGTQSSRYKDLRKQVDALQDELYKVESARDEYRGRADQLEKENKDVTSRNEELQRLADEARALKDEVDALRDMSERVAVYEGTVETYKKKLEELSDLKRQVKILEEKNSDYMQQNMELEEEVKKSGTWRPQLDLYKKQVSDLHQKLAEETKKTDRQVFENKKIFEKLEALTQEKERLALERDMLKENVEELKCTVSALSSPDTASRPPSDLSDIDTLEIIPPEIREKLVRLQHENRVLKQKANDKSEESAPVLQSLLNDLQERHDKLLQENRWEKPSPPSPPYHSQWPPFGRMWPLEAYFMLESPKRPRKLKVLKRNLKWASESDLLVLRQPAHNNFMANLLSSNGHSAKRRNSSPNNKSLTLPSNATAPTSSHPNKENPIVIHHIHEFKMPPSPTNEDSGCCRTSPSSCEGCEDHRSSGSCGIRTPDYGNTLDSGVSGMFRCLSPVIPSIVEECTTHHISDILPAILNQEGNGIPPVLYHTHPTHSTTNHARTNSHHANANCCCSPSKSPCDIASDGIHSKSSSPHQNTCTPFTILSHSLSPHVATQNNDPVDRSVAADQRDSLRHQSSDSPEQDSGGSPQNRKQTSLPQRPDPPDSPTPHNSPRLPHSIHSNRNKGGKFPTSSVLVSTRASSGTQEMTQVQNNKITTTTPSDRQNSSRGSSCEMLEDMQEMPRLRSDTPVLKFLRDSSSQTSDQPEVQSDKPTKPYLETDLDDIFSHRFRPKSRETLNRITGKLRSGIMNKVRSRSLEKYRPSVENVIRIHATTVPNGSPKRSMSLTTQKNPKDDETEKLLMTRLSVSKPQNRVERMRYLGGSNGPSNKLNECPNKIEPVSSQRKSCAFENSPIYKSLKENKLLPLPPSALIECRKKSHAEKGLQRNPPRVNVVGGRPTSGGRVPRDANSCNSSLSPLHKSQSEILLKGRKRNRPPGSTKSLKNSPTSSVNDVGYSKSPSSRESLSSWHNFPTSSTTKRTEKRSPEVTLLTDTLFTHFVVTPKKNRAPNPPKRRSESTPSIPSIRSLPVHLLCPSSSRMSKDNEPLLSDTDTDIELVENRLVSSAYAAPLVSSESSTSILQSDNNTDFDPSATDYCTEPETDFNPRQYKLMNTLDEKRKVRSFQRREELQRADVPDTDALIVSSPHAVIRSNSYFKKKKKQVILASKSKILNGGIVKVKNKTARAVVAETFNAMFTFCTP